MNQTSSVKRFALPLKFMLSVKTRREAWLLVATLIRLKGSLRRNWIKKGIPRDVGLADRLPVSRRLLQEQAGLVLTPNPLNETEVN
jgi:hypothetical protein